jgi:hypothetical protein
MNRDTGAPVLLFAPRHSHYFNGAPEPLPEHLAHLAGAGRGHRVTEATPAEVARLEGWLSELAQGQRRSGFAIRPNLRRRSGCS